MVIVHCSANRHLRVSKERNGEQREALVASIGAAAAVGKKACLGMKRR